MTDPHEKRYQVFVSSTFRDLQEERQKVLQALLEMKAFPTGMELFPSADDEQWEFIKREILSSDYYVVIIAGMYGSLAPDGASYTEKEYDFAIASGKPAMAFLVEDINQLKGAHLESDPARRARLESFREKAAKGKLVKFFKNPDELKAQVWHALTYAFSLQPQEGWIRAKNQRRIEDLEEINRLQKRNTELENEVSRLSADPSAMLQQGDDSVEWEVKWIPGSVPNTKVVTSWNVIFLRLFGDGRPFAMLNQIYAVLMDICSDQLSDDLRSGVQLHGESLTLMASDLAIQFSGLNYITVHHDTPRGREWRITPRGSLHLALLRGRRRDAESAA